MLDFRGMTLLRLVSERIVLPASVVVSGALELLLEKWWKSGENVLDIESLNSSNELRHPDLDFL
jgi:hypothetical protein